MELTEAEQRMVEEYRKEKAANVARAVSRKTVLKVAYEYEAWLQEEGAGSTYSTFCNDFGGYTGPNRSTLFEQVEKMRELAREFSGFAIG